MRFVLLRSALVALMLTITLAGVKPVWAHAVLVESKPQAGSTVAGADLPISLRYNVRVDASRSKLHLLAPDGSAVALDGLKQPTPDTLEAHASGLKPGAYKLQWQVLASDGHISRGEVDFSVK